MPWMAAASAIMTVVSTIAQSNAQRAQGAAQKQEANYVAAQENQNAGQQQASSQRAEIEQQKQTAYVLSNAKGAAAGSGAATTDPGIESNLSQIATEGQYRASTALYEGDAKAQGMRNQASASIYQGQLDQQTANTKANTTLISGASSLFNKYATPFGGGGGSGTYTDPEGITSEAYG